MHRLATALLVVCLAAGGALAAGKPKPWTPRPGFKAAQAKEQVRRFLKARLYYPKSYRSLGWSRLVDHGGGGPYRYSIRHRYAFKPRYGGPGVADMIFLFDPFGHIMGSEAVPPTGVQRRRLRP